MSLEAVKGQRHYLEVLQRLHVHLLPDLYMEIGVRNGGSLQLARGSAVGIDPKNQLTVTLPPSTLFYEMTSDDFFVAARQSDIKEKVDLAFIDGMHLFEYALRDFINIERYATPWTLVMFDDICPNHPLQAARDRQTTVWMGDVWKLRDCLKRYRPDLVQVVLDTSPSGLLLVMGLDPGNSVLSDNYAQILRDYVEGAALQPPEAVLQREGVLPPSDELVKALCDLVITVRGAALPVEEMHKVRKLMEWRGL
ncbi:MAG: class I SAM-dependent methyltransferase [Pseudomonas sp.]|uniref:class I SAM-dependent methyltransferase n=1 Tax=Pseudomonas sp. TaxID=306 RepID=UPI0033996E41